MDGSSLAWPLPTNLHHASRYLPYGKMYGRLSQSRSRKLSAPEPTLRSLQRHQICSRYKYLLSLPKQNKQHKLWWVPFRILSSTRQRAELFGQRLCNNQRFTCTLWQQTLDPTITELNMSWRHYYSTLILLLYIHTLNSYSYITFIPQSPVLSSYNKINFIIMLQPIMKFNDDHPMQLIPVIIIIIN